MKTNKIILGIFLAAATVSCSKAIETVEKDISAAKGTLVTLSASLPEDCKAYVTDGGEFTWGKNDAIAVFISNGTTTKSQKFAIDNSDDGKTSARFSATLDEGYHVVGPALYPYHGSHALNTDGTVRFRMKDYHDYEAGNVQCVMACNVNGGTLQFKHVGAIVRVTIEDFPSQADRFKFSSSDHSTNGTFTLDMSASEPKLTANAAGTTTTYKLSSGVTGLTRVFDVPVPTGSFSNFKVECSRNSDGIKLFTLSSDKDRNLSRGQLLIMKRLSAGVQLANMEEGLPTCLASQVNSTAISAVDNPHQDGLNPSTKVLLVDASHNSTNTPGKFKIMPDTEHFYSGVRDNTLSVKFKVFYANEADAKVYCPRVRFSAEGNDENSVYHVPSKINEVEYDGTNWNELINPTGWNSFEYIGNIQASGIVNVKGLLEMNGSQTDNAGSRKIYMDDFVLTK